MPRRPREYNNGEIDFIIYKKQRSLTSAIFLLLDTRYEENNDVRNIEIKKKPTGPALNNNSTRKSVARLIDFKYDIKIPDNMYYLINFKNMFRESNTIGDLFDNARKMIISEIKFHFNINKYNL